VHYVTIYATGRNVATPNGKKQVKTIIIPIDFAGRGVLEKWKICPWKVLEFLVQKGVWTLKTAKKCHQNIRYMYVSCRAIISVSVDLLSPSVPFTSTLLLLLKFTCIPWDKQDDNKFHPLIGGGKLKREDSTIWCKDCCLAILLVKCYWPFHLKKTFVLFIFRVTSNLM